MALSYIGGKSKIGKWIVPFIPRDIETYIEPFSGMFWVFFNMDLTKYPNLKNVVYNDFNPLNYNLFQCLQNPERLLEEVNNIPCQQRGEFPTPDIYNPDKGPQAQDVRQPLVGGTGTDYMDTDILRRTEPSR